MIFLQILFCIFGLIAGISPFLIPETKHLEVVNAIGWGMAVFLSCKVFDD